jgi:hypothetical protein
MGEMYGLRCKKCGFEAELGTEQPYFTMSGSLTDKYCPKTEQIVCISRVFGVEEPEISCQNEEWQKEFGAPDLCRDCKGECLQDLESLAPEGDEEFRGYKCPRCGGDLDRNGGIFSIICID